MKRQLYLAGNAKLLHRDFQNAQCTVLNEENSQNCSRADIDLRVQFRCAESCPRGSTVRFIYFSLGICGVARQCKRGDCSAFQIFRVRPKIADYLRCALHYYAAACPTGRLCDGTALSSFSDCPAGSRCRDGVSTVCGTGMYAPANSDTCFSCTIVSVTIFLLLSLVNVTIFLLLSLVNVTILLGSYCPNTQNEAPTQCGTGIYTDKIEQASCLTCTAGWACQNGQRTVCQSIGLTHSRSVRELWSEQLLYGLAYHCSVVQSVSHKTKSTFLPGTVYSPAGSTSFSGTDRIRKYWSLIG
eukprot:sb/3467385/